MHDVNAQTALDMRAARQGGTVQTVQIAEWLHHSSEALQRRDRVRAALEADPVFSKRDSPFLTHAQKVERSHGQILRMHQILDAHGWGSEELKIMMKLIGSEPAPWDLHEGAFRPVVMSQGSNEQAKKWGELMEHYRVFGAYAQTELGHGTQVSSLETTATYDPVRKEFEIHTPTLTARKWWIGAAGKTANVCVVQARLLLDAGRKEMGPHLFWVQIRDWDTHELMPGVKTGDIGPKAYAGYGGVDNGYLMFDRVRIPRENMLCRFAQVTPDGEYVKPPHAKLSYGGMVSIRANMIESLAWHLASASTVSIRYATVRRQGGASTRTGGLEQQVISYPSTYMRLIPLLAKAYAFIIVGRSMSELFNEMAGLLRTGDTSLLAEAHAVSSGLKVFVSEQVTAGLESARKSMGGHGYSAFSGIGNLFANFVPSQTYEGDNFVLNMQVARAALKTLLAIRSNPSQHFTPSSSYLSVLTLASLPRISAPEPHVWLDHSGSPALCVLDCRAALLVQQLEKRIAAGETSLESASWEAARIAKAVSQAFVASRAADALQDDGLLAHALGKGSREWEVMRNVLQLYILTSVEEGLADVLELQVLDPASDSVATLRQAILQLAQSIVPEAIRLTDAFSFSDWELNSALGVADGRVYEALISRAGDEPLNQTDIVGSYKSSLKPLFERGKDKARIRTPSKL